MTAADLTPIAIPEDAQGRQDPAAATEVWAIRHGESEGDRGLLHGQRGCLRVARRVLAVNDAPLSDPTG